MRFRKSILLSAALLGLSVAGCGAITGTKVAESGAIALHGKPQVIQPVAGQAPSASAGSSSGTNGAGAAGDGVVSVAPSSGPLPQPASNAQVEAELTASGINPNPDRATLTSSGLAIPPANAPAPVVAAIEAGNEIAHLPYIWGGGHVTYEDNGYDCSGSLSFILAAAGLLTGTETSGQLMSYGDPGPGRWITIYANAGHTFAYIAGLRFDTVALAESGTRWSNRPADESNLPSFAIRHPVGF